MNENLSQRVLGRTAEADARLDAFVSEALVAAGRWDCWLSDGMQDFRVVEDGPTRARICGDLWTIDQSRHVFWLDLRLATDAPDAVDWTLYYDLVAAPRRVRNAVYEIDSPDGSEWSEVVSGRTTTSPPPL